MGGYGYGVAAPRVYGAYGAYGYHPYASSVPMAITRMRIVTVIIPTIAVKSDAQRKPTVHGPESQQWQSLMDRAKIAQAALRSMTSLIGQ